MLVIVAGPVLWLVLTLLCWLASARFPRTFRYTAGMLLAVNFLYIPIYALMSGQPFGALVVTAAVVGVATASGVVFGRRPHREATPVGEESVGRPGKERQQLLKVEHAGVASDAEAVDLPPPRTGSAGGWFLDIALSGLSALVLSMLVVLVLAKAGVLGTCFEGSCGYVGMFAVFPLLWPTLMILFLFLARRFPQQARPIGWGSLLVVPVFSGVLTAARESLVAAIGVLFAVGLIVWLVVFVVRRPRDAS